MSASDILWWVRLLGDGLAMVQAIALLGGCMCYQGGVGRSDGRPWGMVWPVGWAASLVVWICLIRPSITQAMQP